VDVTVLEARDRIGGRLWTLHPDGLSVPVELGAEFLHGEAPELDELIRSAGLRAVDIAGRRWTARDGKLALMDDFWERLDRVMRHLRADLKVDRSFADALSSPVMRRVTAKDRKLATQYVEGFHAAEPSVISEQSLAEGGSPRGDVRQRRIGRVVEGYDGVVRALASTIQDRIRLGTVVHRVRWRAGRVEVDARNLAGEPLSVVRADAVIVAVPLGVLQAPAFETGAIAFDPAIPRLDENVSFLAMGTVTRIALRLDEPFWATHRFASRMGDERLDTLAFLHSMEAVDFPVWWTTYPLRAPLLVGWCGGPHARELAGLTPDTVRAKAVESLATLLGMTRGAVAKHVVAAFTHDWMSDPFARGAYSYARTGGMHAAARLAKPIDDTVWFVGEHADAEGRNGTVHGAIATGWKAADAIAG
jgi:monoamine oxidase